jgi:hypothetical protein
MVKNPLLKWWLDKVNQELASKGLILTITHFNNPYENGDNRDTFIDLSNFKFNLKFVPNNEITPPSDFSIQLTDEFGIKEASYSFKKDVIRNILYNLGEKIRKELASVSNVYSLEQNGKTLYVLIEDNGEITSINPYNFRHGIERFLNELLTFNFTNSYSNTMGFANILNLYHIETAYNFQPVVLDKTPSLPTDLDLSTCDETNKYRVFVQRHQNHYGSFTIDPSQVDNQQPSFPRCEITGYLLTHLSNPFNERESVSGFNGFISNYAIRNLIVQCSFCGKNKKKDNTETAYICKGCTSEFTKYGLDLETFSINRYSIHDHDHKQRLYFLDTPNDTDKRLYLGVELEVDSEYLDERNEDGNPCGCDDEDCEECSAYYNRENNGYINHNKYANIVLHKLNGKDNGKVIAKYDGSLSSGFEIVSQPATYNAHTENNLINWRDSMKVLKDIGYSSHDLGTCGLHVHINRDFFGDTTDAQNYNGAKIVYLMEKHWGDFVLFSRRRGHQLDRWAKIQNAKGDYDNSTEKTTRSLRYAFQKNYYNNRDKYVAVNTLHDATFEFRIFRGTLNYETFKATLQFVDNLARLVKKTTLAKLTSITFDDILNFKKYPELQSYWAKRKGGTLTEDRTPNENQ